MVWLVSSCGVIACMYMDIFSWYAESRPMRIKAMLIIIESRKQMRNRDDVKPRVHTAPYCLHVCISVFMHVCLPLCIGLRDSWLSSIALKKRYCSVWATPIQNERERLCMCKWKRLNLESKQEIWKRANYSSLEVCSMLCVALYLVVQHVLACTKSAHFVCMWYALAIMTILA